MKIFDEIDQYVGKFINEAKGFWYPQFSDKNKETLKFIEATSNYIHVKTFEYDDTALQGLSENEKMEHYKNINKQLRIQLKVPSIITIDIPNNKIGKYIHVFRVKI